MQARPKLSIRHTAPLALLVLAGTAAAATPQTLEATAVLGFEVVHLPQREAMGLVGGAYLFDIGDNWRLGPAVYGAATGHRGGLFVGGAELRRQWALGGQLHLSTGLYLGGGGGAAAPVGGGLMLRPSVTLLGDLAPGLQAGVSWSQVRFPSGGIKSNQLGLLLQWRSDFKHYGGAAAGEPASGGPSGLGLDHAALSVGQYRFSGGGGRRIGLVGARAEWAGSGPLRLGIESAAAAQGDAAGYMEILGSAATGLELLPGLNLGLRAAVGLGGGGAVLTEGGMIGKLSGTLAWQFATGWRAGVDFGVLRALQGGLQARQASAWLGMDLEPAAGSGGRVVRTDWTAVLQHHAGIARSDGTDRALDTVGLKLDRYLGESFYLTGQAHSAFAGGAGAYSIGLLGAGAARSVAPQWRVGAELLAGAAGGGGVQTGGGALGQALAWAGWTPERSAGEWRLGAGMRRPLRSGQSTWVAELGWSRSFGVSDR